MENNYKIFINKIIITINSKKKKIKYKLKKYYFNLVKSVNVAYLLLS